MSAWLTDVPASATPFLGGHPGWLPLRAGEDAALEDLAACFNPDRPTWIARAHDCGFATPGPVVVIDEAPRSQFDAMLDFTRQPPDAAGRIVCLALTGSRFRGQRARPWTALRGNLHLTACYRLQGVGTEHQAAITMIPAVAAAETIAACGGGRLQPRIKWVNDVFVQGGKVAGVLASTRLSGTSIDQVVFGIGMNLDHAPEIQPTPFVPAAGHLAGFDPALRGSLPAVFRALVERLDALVACLESGAAADVFARYRGLAGFIGERVCLWPEGTEAWERQEPLLRGRVTDLLPDLSLVVEGAPAPVRHGRMAYESVWSGFVS